MDLSFYDHSRSIKQWCIFIKTSGSFSKQIFANARKLGGQERYWILHIGHFGETGRMEVFDNLIITILVSKVVEMLFMVIQFEAAVGQV